MKLTLQIEIDTTEFIAFKDATNAQRIEFIKFNIGEWASISQSNPLSEYALFEDAILTDWFIQH